VTTREHEAHVVCRLDELPPGSRRISVVDGKSIGVFNVDGHLHALLNRCPHKGAELCRGPLTGSVVGAADGRYLYDDGKRVLRCAWHGWEFDLSTGGAIADPRIRARTYPVSVVDGEILVLI